MIFSCEIKKVSLISKIFGLIDRIPLFLAVSVLIFFIGYGKGFREGVKRDEILHKTLFSEISIHRHTFSKLFAHKSKEKGYFVGLAFDSLLTILNYKEEVK